MRSFRFFVPYLVLLVVSVNTGFAAEFFRKQTGTTTIAAGSTSRTVAITSLDMSKSFLVFSSTLSDASPTNYQIGGEITNSTTLTFERTGNSGTVSISWQVFEFEGGVSVQRGSTSVALSTNVDIAISCVDLTKSFVIVSARKSGAQLGNDDGVTANLTSTTNLRLVTGTAGAAMEEVYWQVIEYQASTVKKVTATLAGGSTSTTSTIAPAVGNLAKAFVISNHIIGGDSNPDDLPRTELTNASTVTYTRVGTTNTMTFVTYVIELTDGSSVVRGTQTFGTADVSLPVSIVAGTSSGVFGSGNYGRQGSSTFATNDNMGTSWFTYEITSTTNLQISRAVAGGATADVPWQVVTFEDTGLQQNTFYSRLAGPTAWESNTAWSFTPDGSSGAVPTGVYPRRTNNVVIQSGHTIAINNVNDNGPCSQSPQDLGRSNVAAATPTGPFTGSTDQMFYHTGDIIVSTGGTLTSSEEVMLEGYTLLENGSTFTITEDIVNLGYLEISTTANFDNTDDLILSGNSITIMNNTTTSDDDLYIDDTDATLCGEGVMNIGADPSPTDPTIQYWNAATIAQVCSGFTVGCGNPPPGGPPCPGGFPMSGTGGFSSGNSGPGGVGSLSTTGDVRLWLDANNINQANGTNVTVWNDLSGYSNNAVAPGGNEPVFNTNQLNGFPDIHFTAANSDHLRVADHPSLEPTTVSIFAVGNHTASSGGFAGYISKIRVGVDPFDGYALVRNGATSNVLFSIDAIANAVVGTGAYGTNTIMSGIYNKTNLQLFHNETSQGTDVYTADILSHNHFLYIGALSNAAGNGANVFLDGDIAEAVVFGRGVNAAQRIIIDNYLSAKYAIAIAAANNVYTMDDGAAIFDFEVAGIGQTAISSFHKDSRGRGIVRMWNPSGLGNGEFLMWGHNNAALTSTTTTSPADVDGTVIEERLSRIWRVSETGGDVGTVSISFDFNGVGGSPLGSNLRLLIDRDGDGFGDNDVTPIVGSVSGGIAVFSNVNFQDGDRFTLGNTDASAPLPVELVEFTAQPVSQSVLITWITESELNNDYFTIERSTEGEQWAAIEQIKGSGTTNRSQQYQAFDEYPLSGVSYYRLKQTDFDGTAAYSHIVSVKFDGLTGLRITPNPSSGIFTIMGTGLADSQMRLLNSLGQLVNAPISNDGPDTILDMSSFPAGIYVLQVLDGVTIRSMRLFKR